jgi:hypothetical protein
MKGETMIQNHFDGKMVQRVEKPVLSPIQRLRKIKADRLELEELKKLDPPVKARGSRPTFQSLIDLMNVLTGE